MNIKRSFCLFQYDINSNRNRSTTSIRNSW